MCEIFDQKLDFKNSSIIYEISKSFDFKDENEEEILIKKLQSLQSGTDYIISPSIRKIKPKTNNESTEATGTLNVRVIIEKYISETTIKTSNLEYSEQ